MKRALALVCAAAVFACEDWSSLSTDARCRQTGLCADAGTGGGAGGGGSEAMGGGGATGGGGAATGGGTATGGGGVQSFDAGLCPPLKTAVSYAPRRAHTATLLPCNRILVTGGVSPITGTLVDSIDLYDVDSSNWYRVLSSPLVRQRQSAVLLTDGGVLIAGGHDLSGGTGMDTVVVGYSAGDFTVNAGPLLTTPRDATALVPWGTGALMVNGSVMGSYSEMYTGTGFDTFDATGAFRGIKTVAVIEAGGDVIASGGANSTSVSKEVHRFVLGQNHWADAASMQVARYMHTLSALPDGGVVAIGGSDAVSTSPLASIELLEDAGTEAMLNTPRCDHTASPLPDGGLLVCGGMVDAAGTPDRSCEAVSFAPLMARSAVAMTMARAAHTATVLLDGRIVVIGGADAGTCGVEVYRPDLRTWTCQ